MPFSLVFQQLFATFAGDLVMYQVFHRCIKGNQVQILSSTRYCHLHYGKSNEATDGQGWEGGLFGESQETCHVGRTEAPGPGNRAAQKKRDEQKNDEKTVRTVGDGIHAIHPLCDIPSGGA